MSFKLKESWEVWAEGPGGSGAPACAVLSCDHGLRAQADRDSSMQMSFVSSKVKTENVTANHDSLLILDAKSYGVTTSRWIQASESVLLLLLPLKVLSCSWSKLPHFTLILIFRLLYSLQDTDETQYLNKVTLQNCEVMSWIGESKCSWTKIIIIITLST